MKEFILMVVIIITGGAAYYLYKDYHKAPDFDQATANREVIGEVVSAENNVKRQFNQDLLWNNIEKKEPIYNQDSIRTGKDSSTVLKLMDNTVIEVSENSLIVLDRTQNNFDINFKAGQVE